MRQGKLLIWIEGWRHPNFTGIGESEQPVCKPFVQEPEAAREGTGWCQLDDCRYFIRLNALK